MRTSMRFYDALPKRKAELVDGKLYVAGSLEKSAMTLGYMVEQLGAGYVADLVPKNLLQNAVIEIYGSGKPVPKKLADFTPITWNYYLPHKLATDLQMSLWHKEGFTVWSNGMVIKLGEDVFTPDVYLLKNENYHRLKEYYLDGPPDLTIEIGVPSMRAFDAGIRLERYAAGGVPEVWMLDFENKTFEPLLLHNGNYQKASVEGKFYHSTSMEGLSVEHSRIFDSAEEFGIQIIDDLFQVKLPNPQPKIKPSQSEYTVEYGTIPFAPRLDLDPVPITFEEFISWGGEVKFEMMDGKPVFGGGDETTKEWLGLLMMTLGLKETVKYLSPEEWAGAL